IAHTTADYDTASAAIGAGARHITHLYNAMPPYSHRAPGVIGAAMENDDVFVELIADGIHIHPAVVRNTFRAFGPERVILISDSCEAAGMEDGEYELGGQKVFKKGRRATLSDGTLAGSASNLMDCLRQAVKMGVPKELAVRAATFNPAFEAGISDRVGQLVPGKKAFYTSLRDI
ncbi:MAG: amidohydrolase family protein, partial [Lachnospiraceae bacterium]|nr:amidohydrolase family protein [Lachnospiraceae bacterium]